LNRADESKDAQSVIRVYKSTQTAYWISWRTGSCGKEQESMNKRRPKQFGLTYATNNDLLHTQLQ